MPFPAEGMELGPHNLIDDVRGFLESQYKNKYYVYNLTQRTYDNRKFNQRVRSLLSLNEGFFLLELFIQPPKPEAC